MADADKVPPRSSQIEQDHEGLRVHADRLRKLFDDSPVDISVLADTGRHLLDEFREVLERHWELEETTGLLADVNRVRPALVAKEAGLLEEHKELRKGLADLLAAFETLQQPEGISPSELGEKVVCFVQRLETHEHAERELMMDVYYTDLGGGD